MTPAYCQPINFIKVYKFAIFLAEDKIAAPSALPNDSLFHFGILNKFPFFAIMEKSGYFFEHFKTLTKLRYLSVVKVG